MWGLLLVALVACSSPAARQTPPVLGSTVPLVPADAYIAAPLDAAPHDAAPLDAAPLDAAPHAEPPPLVPEARGTVVVTTTDECGMMLDSVYFPEGSAMPKGEQMVIVDQTAAMFLCLQKQGQTFLIEVSGHADAREPDGVTLSDSRARVILGALVMRGVPEAWLRSQGYGATQPRDRRRTAWARSINRRVEFLILKRSP